MAQVSAACRTALLVGIPGVLVTATPGGATGTTDGSGGTVFAVGAAGPYTLTPTLAGWTFAPTSIDVVASDDSTVEASFTGTADAAGTTTEVFEVRDSTLISCLRWVPPDTLIVQFHRGGKPREESEYTASYDEFQQFRDAPSKGRHYLRAINGAGKKPRVNCLPPRLPNGDVIT